MAVDSAPFPALVSTRAEYDRVAHVYAPVAIGVFAVIVVVVVVSVLVFRRRPPERAARWAEHNRLEGAYAVLLAGAAAVLLGVTFSAEHQIDTVAARERPGLVIDVTGAKWEWRFGYAGYGIQRYSGTVGHQPLVVPTDTAIEFRLESLDVIHAFWVPELEFKRALFPDHVNTAVLTFTRPGSFPGQCAEFCGLFHYAMTFTVDAMAPGAFAAWLGSQRAHPDAVPIGAPAIFAPRRAA